MRPVGASYGRGRVNILLISCDKALTGPKAIEKFF